MHCQSACRRAGEGEGKCAGKGVMKKSLTFWQACARCKRLAVQGFPLWLVLVVAGCRTSHYCCRTTLLNPVSTSAKPLSITFLGRLCSRSLWSPAGGTLSLALALLFSCSRTHVRMVAATWQSVDWVASHEPILTLAQAQRGPHFLV